MFNIASSFATTWKLNFNSNKSKVLVVGKRIDKSNKWVLGDNTDIMFREHISEVFHHNREK
jgi:hypothetical protein